MTAFCVNCNLPTTMSKPTTTRPTDPTCPHPLLKAAQALLPEMIAIRRKLHQHPEVGLELPWTKQVVVDAVKELGLTPILSSGTIGSVVAFIDGALPGPTILLRGDMDALPLQEDTGLDFASEINGAMHACGHDMHVAMLLGAARLLLLRKDRLAGRILLMFQPGEEGFHGARVMLEEGLLALAAPSAVKAAFAVHVYSALTSGQILSKGGPMLASADMLRIIVRGKGGHASMPQGAVDPITAAAHVRPSRQNLADSISDRF